MKEKKGMFSRCMAALLSLVMVLGMVLPYVPAQAETTDNTLTVTGIVTQNVDNPGAADQCWSFNFNVDGTWPTSGSFEQYTGQGDGALFIKDSQGTVNFTGNNSANVTTYKNGGYFFLKIWGSYTNVNLPQEGDTIVLPEQVLSYEKDATKTVQLTKTVLKYTGGTWTVTEPSLEVSGVYKFEKSNHWRFWLDVTGEWVAPAGTKYSNPTDWTVTIMPAEGDAVIVPSGAVTVHRSDSQLLIPVWGTYTDENAPAKGDKILIPAGTFTSQTDTTKADTLAKAVVLVYDGSDWSIDQDATDDANYTKLKIKGFHNHGVNSGNPQTGGKYDIYLDVENELPGELWNEHYTLKTVINETDYDLTGVLGTTKEQLYIALSTDIVPYGGDATVTIEAGIYTSDKGNGIKLDSDWTFYISKYGMSTSNKIWDANIPKLTPTLGSNHTASGYYLTMDQEDSIPIGWADNIEWVNNSKSTDDTFYFYQAANAENGYKLDGDMQDGTMRLKHPGEKSYYVALSDIYKSADAVPDGTYELCGAYCDSNGNIVVFNSYEVKRTTTDAGTTYEPNVTCMPFILTDIDQDNTKYDDTNKRYNVYLKPSAKLSDTVDQQFNGLQVQIGDADPETVTIWRAGHDPWGTGYGSFFFVLPEKLISKDVAEGTKVTLKKGKMWTPDGKSGIELTEDFVMYAKGNGEGFTTTTPVTYTQMKIDAFRQYTKYNAESEIWQVYLKTNVSDLPGAKWDERYDITLQIGETNVTVEAMQADDPATMYFYISKDQLPADQDTTVVLKAGKYACKDTEVRLGYELTEDFTFYASKHGFSTNQKIWDQNVVENTLTLADSQGYGASSVMLVPGENDGLTPDDTNWSVRIKSVVTTESFDTADTVYFTAENGLFVDGVYQTKQFPLVRLSGGYYVGFADAFSDSGWTASVGTEYTIGGVFYSTVDGQLMRFAPITVKWNGTNWSVVTDDIQDTYKSGDINGDNKTDACDLIRMLNYYNKENGLDVAVNSAQMDMNRDGKTDEKDIAAMRKYLIGRIAYIERMAYSCPSCGTWNDERTVFTPDPELDEKLQAYKATGFTMLLSEFVGVLKDDVLDEEHQPELVTYLKAAGRNGLGVIVCSTWLNALLKNEIEGINFTDMSADGVTPKWQAVLSQYVNFLSQYPAFRGFMMADELQIKYAENYKKVVTYLKQIDPDLMLHSSQVSSVAYTASGWGPGTLTLDTTTNSTEELAYKDYVRNFGIVNGSFTFDLYPLLYTDKLVGSNTYSVNSKWYDNLKWTSDVVNEQKGAMTMGVTIQSCKLEGTGNIWSSTERYAPTQKSDIGFQVYTAMAYGANEINYFTYEDHPTDQSVSEAIADNAEVQAAVTAVNQEVASFGYVYKSFNWLDTLDIAKGKTNSSTGNSRLASVKSASGRAFVGCMRDSDGFDGYMIANAEGPRTSTSVTVTLTFNKANSVTVYKGTSCTTQDITDGTYSVTLSPGEGAFVIPNYK